MRKVKSIVFKYITSETYRVIKTHNYCGATPGEEYESIHKFYNIEGLDVVVK